MSSETVLARAAHALKEADLAQRRGKVSDLIGLIIEASGLEVEIGEVCLVGNERRRDPVATEVVGFRGGRTLLMPLGELHGIGPGTLVNSTGAPFRVAVGESLLGRVIDGLGNPLDERPRARGRFLALDHCRPSGRAEPASDPRSSRPRCARTRRADPMRARPAPGHLRRIRRREIVAARHDRPLDDGRGQRDRPCRRARARGEGIHRA